MQLANRLKNQLVIVVSLMVHLFLWFISVVAALLKICFEELNNVQK
jgi:hypothetical protein